MLSQRIKIIVFITLISSTAISQEISGLFVSPLVGIRIPIQESAKKFKTGFSFGGSLEYGNSEIPFIIKFQISYTLLPQRQLYRDQFESKSMTGVSLGVDYLFYPLIAAETIVTPFMSFDLTYNYIERQIITYTYKFETFTKPDSKLGFNVGFGISFFLVDFVFKYFFMPYEPYLGLDYKLRLPIHITL